MGAGRRATDSAGLLRPEEQWTGQCLLEQHKGSDVAQGASVIPEMLEVSFICNAVVKFELLLLVDFVCPQSPVRPREAC